jgi:hypothetical protein
MAKPDRILLLKLNGEIIRAIVQRIEIAPTNIAVVLRLPTETSARGVDPIVVTLSRA